MRQCSSHSPWHPVNMLLELLREISFLSGLPAPNSSHPASLWSPTDQRFFLPQTSHLRYTNTAVCSFQSLPIRTCEFKGQAVYDTYSCETDRQGAGGKPKAAVGGGPVLSNHFGIVLRSLAAPEKVCSLGCSRSLYLTSLFPQLDVMCLNAGIPPAKVHAVCSDVGRILIII